MLPELIAGRQVMGCAQILYGCLGKELLEDRVPGGVWGQ